MGNLRGVTASEEIEYSPPPVKLLKQSTDDRGGPSAADHEAIGRALLAALREFGVDAKIVGVVSGPHVSRYELQLAPGIKVAKIAQLKDDLAYALASTEIRILAPIPGKRAVGVEVPNRHRRTVRLGDIYRPRPSGASPLVGWLGKDVAGQPVWTDISRMPHVLIAGTTGSGKSGCVNALLSSILLHASPNEVRLVLVDPKRVELNHYDSLPHLLTPVVTAPRVAANVLANLISEMDNRYEVMEGARARSLDELNRVRRKSGEPPLPHVLCVIDELADLMMVAPAEVEDSIIRLAQKSRAVGIHLVLATQRPSTDVITGTIKVNIPARIAFAVASQVDSRVILDQGGAESLLGQGDMLFRAAGTSKLERIQGAFITEEEIAKLTSHWARQGEPEFDEELLEARPEAEEGLPAGELSPDQDELLAEAVRIVVQTETASVSMIQRRLRVGYTRAGRLIDMLERRGVISGYEGSKPRQVLIGPSDVPRILGEASPNAESAPETPEPAEVLS
jgi:S-DNA-T family DNA segregation ATPase FtsK/SpoIIIE